MVLEALSLITILHRGEQVHRSVTASVTSLGELEIVRAPKQKCWQRLQRTGRQVGGISGPQLPRTKGKELCPMLTKRM